MDHRTAFGKILLYNKNSTRFEANLQSAYLKDNSSCYTNRKVKDKKNGKGNNRTKENIKEQSGKGDNNIREKSRT